MDVQSDEMRKAYHSALRMLARREHTVAEIQTKLQGKFSDLTDGELSDLSDTLVGDGYLSDARFAETLIRSRIARGYGPCYIRRELFTKGISALLINQQMSIQHTNWEQLASDLVERRHPQAACHDQAWEKAARFLQRRGFDAECVVKTLGQRP